MKLSISSKIFKLFPQLKIGMAVLEDIDNSGSSPEILSILRHAEQRIRDKYANTYIAEIPQIKCWRQAYKKFRAKGYASSIESLAKRALKSQEIWNINNLVNLYNSLSLKYMLPFGGEDLSQIKGDLGLVIAQGGEECLVLGDDQISTIKQDEIIYQDALGPVCRRWNWREADRAKLTHQTKQAVLVCEDLYSGKSDLCQKAITELVSLAEKFLRAKGKVIVLDNAKQVVFIK